MEEMKIPCRIGDKVWALRSFNGTIVPRLGTVSQMIFVGEEMEISITVKGAARGRWGKEIFPTREEALKAIEERRANGLDDIY